MLERARMAAMATKPKRPRDPFQLAKLIGDISTAAQDKLKTKTPTRARTSMFVVLRK
jgi:hypothetical protein